MPLTRTIRRIITPYFGEDVSLKALSGRYLRERLIPELDLKGVKSIQERPGRQTFWAKSPWGTVAVKVYDRAGSSEPARFLQLQPLLDVLDPPRLVHAEVDASVIESFGVSSLVFKWIKGRPVDLSSNEQREHYLRRLAAIHDEHTHTEAERKIQGSSRDRIQEERSNQQPGSPAANEEKLYRSFSDVKEEVDAAMEDFVDSLKKGQRDDAREAHERVLEGVQHVYDSSEAWSLIHGDPWHENFRLEPGGRLRVIDFDTVRFAPFELELADVTTRLEDVRFQGPGSSLDAAVASMDRLTDVERTYLSFRDEAVRRSWLRCRTEALRHSLLLRARERLARFRRLAAENPSTAKQAGKSMRGVWKSYLRRSGFKA